VFVLHSKDGEHIQPGDMCRITDGQVSKHKERLQLNLDRSSGRLKRFGDQDMMVGNA
jgi:hypothetical protein